jgi:hypothetical protein
MSSKPPRRKFVNVSGRNGMNNLENALRNYKGYSVTISWGDDIFDVNMTRDIPKSGFSSFFESDIFQQFQMNSEETFFNIWAKRNPGGDMPDVKIVRLRQAKPKRKRQSFRDGISHCVFHPIRDWAEDALENSKSKSATKRYKAFLNKLDEFEKQYRGGVPEDKLEEICERLQIGVKITLPLVSKEDNAYIDVRSHKKPLKVFTFINTRLDHVESTALRTDNVIDVNDYKEMKKILKRLRKKNEYHIYTKTKHINTITTLNEKYNLYSSHHEMIKEFEKSSGLSNCYICDIHDKELSEFVRAGVHYNGTVDFSDERENLTHIDMEKAYANFSKCKYYAGFLGKITDYRKTDKIEGLGLYRVSKMNFDNCEENFKKILLKLNSYHQGNVYGSPELKYLQDNGVTFEVIEGCWGVEPLNFEFPQEFYEKNQEGSAHYSTYVGSCNTKREYNRYWTSGTHEFAQVLKSHTEADIQLGDDNEYSVQYKREYMNHLSHFTAFITMYTRISAIDQLTKLNFNNIVRICTDGIYFKGDMVELVNVFRVKDDFKFGNAPAETYLNNIDFIDEKVRLDEFISKTDYRENHTTELHLGAGGCGKTHYNLHDKGLIKVLYVAPSWKLASKKREETGCKCNVLANLVGADKQKHNEILRYYNVIIFDEVSMYSDETRRLLFNRFKGCKLIFCGDVGYQLPAFSSDKTKVIKQISKKAFEHVKTYKKNYRVTDKKLKNLCSEMRKCIKRGRRINYMVKDYFNEFLPSHVLGDLTEVYDIEDMILIHTNKEKDYYTELCEGMFLIDGQEVEKYYIKDNTQKGLYTGDIVISEKKPSNGELRHAFTVHSIQGETAKNKLLIDLTNMNTAQMIYTAISRARTLDQIYIKCG